MSWPWSTIGLPEDATPIEIRGAYGKWQESVGDQKTDDERLIERAFEAALQLADERDPSFLPPGSDYPNPWRDPDAPETLPVPHPAHPPVASADMLATALLGLARSSPDFDALCTGVGNLRAWRDAHARNGADLVLREWLIDNNDLDAAKVVRLARLFDWNPQTPSIQDADRDAQWRQLISAAYAQIAPPDAGFTHSMGRGFLMVGAIAAVGLALVILPRIMAGGGRLLIPLLFAGACAYFLIRWKR